MKKRLRTWHVALLAAVVMAGLTSAASAESPSQARRTVANRQRIRASVARAIADGELTRREQYFILLAAKGLLPAGELRGLEQRLNELRFAQQPRSRQTRTKQPEIIEPEIDEPEIIEPEIDEPVIRTTAAEEPVKDKKTTQVETEPKATFAGLPLPKKDFLTRIVSFGRVEAQETAENPFKEESVKPVPEMGYDDSFEIIGVEGEAFTNQLDFFDETCDGPVRNWNHIRLSTTVDAFKGPLDLNNHNGNFGFRLGVEGGFPLIKAWGIGVQAGTSGVVADFYGTQFTGDKIRSQNFTTVGFFQRVPLGAGKLRWGFAYDFMFDDYYTRFDMSQWRIKIGYDITPCKQIGVWVAIPDRGDTALLDGQELGFATPVNQGNLYYNRCWNNGTETTAWIGLSEEPGQVVFGGDARIPLNHRLAFFGNLNYIMPSASGIRGQDEEQWNVSMGFEWTLGCGENVCRTKSFAPMFPVANNGTFSLRLQ